jgi:hypothetical protein
MHFIDWLDPFVFFKFEKSSEVVFFYFRIGHQFNFDQEYIHQLYFQFS